jgi:hypothetical protein
MTKPLAKRCLNDRENECLALTNEMIKRGMLVDSPESIEAQVNELLNFSDAAFDSMKKFVEKQSLSPALNAIAGPLRIPVVGTRGPIGRGLSNSIVVLTISDGTYDDYSTRVLCATESEDDAKTIVESLMSLAEYKKTIGKDVQKFYHKWNSKNAMPQVKPKMLNDPELFEKYRQACKAHFAKRQVAIEEYENIKEAATQMPEIAKNALPLVDDINPDWSSVSFAYSRIAVVR